MLEQSIIDGLDPNVKAALLERQKGHDQFLRGQTESEAPSDKDAFHHADFQNDFFRDDVDDEPIPPTSRAMGGDDLEDPLMRDIRKNRTHNRYGGDEDLADGEDLGSQKSVALTDKSEEDTMEKRRNYVVEIIDLAEELNCYNTLPDEMSMMAMPFKRLVTMWHLFEERVSRANILRMVRNAFAIVCIAASKGLDFFLRKVLNNSFMDFSLWEKSFFAYVTTERKHHKPPFDRAFQKIINRFSSIKELMSGEGSLIVMTGMHMYREYKRQEQVRKDAENEANRMRKEAMDEMKAELREQIQREMNEQRRKWPMPPPSPVSVAASVPEFDTQSLMSQSADEEQGDDVVSVAASEPLSVQSNRSSLASSASSVNEQKEKSPSPEPEEEKKGSPTVHKIPLVAVAPTIPSSIEAVNDPLNIEVNVDLDQYDKLDDTVSQATSRTQQSKKKRAKKVIVPDLVL